MYHVADLCPNKWGFCRSATLAVLAALSPPGQGLFRFCSRTLFPCSQRRCPGDDGWERPLPWPCRWDINLVAPGRRAAGRAEDLLARLRLLLLGFSCLVSKRPVNCVVTKALCVSRFTACSITCFDRTGEITPPHLSVLSGGCFLSYHLCSSKSLFYRVTEAETDHRT